MRIITGAPTCAKLALIGSLLILLSCAGMQDLMNIQTPNVTVANARFLGISFEGVDLAFDVNIDNPNSLAATLAGFDYAFNLNSQPFLNGQQNTPTRIEAKNQSTVQVPISLNFKDIYNTVQSLNDADSTAYGIDFGLNFDLPVLGTKRIPITKTGFLPLIRLPKISIGSLKLDKLGFTGADLSLNIELDNPNAYSMVLNKLDYGFSINGKNWANGVIEQALQVNKNGKSAIKIPVSLNFLEMGQTVYQLVSGNQALNYSFDSQVDLSTAIPLLDKVNLNLDKSGSISITK